MENELPPESEDIARKNLEHFNVRREMIVHEDNQVNTRIEILVVSQSIFFAVVGTQVQDPSFNLVTFSMAGVSIVLCFVLDYAVIGAHAEQDVVKSSRREYEMLFPFKGPKADAWRVALQSRKPGRAGPRIGMGEWMPKICAFAWLPILYQVISQQWSIIPAIVAVGGLAAVQLATFIAIYYKCRPKK